MATSTLNNFVMNPDLLTVVNCQSVIMLSWTGGTPPFDVFFYDPGPLGAMGGDSSPAGNPVHTSIAHITQSNPGPVQWNVGGITSRFVIVGVQDNSGTFVGSTFLSVTGPTSNCASVSSVAPVVPNTSPSTSKPAVLSSPAPSLSSQSQLSQSHSTSASSQSTTTETSSLTKSSDSSSISSLTSGSTQATSSTTVAPGSSSSSSTLFPAPSANTLSSQHKTTSTGAVAGGTVAAFIVIIALALLLFRFLCRSSWRTHRKALRNDSETTTERNSDGANSRNMVEPFERRASMLKAPIPIPYNPATTGKRQLDTSSNNIATSTPPAAASSSSNALVTNRSPMPNSNSDPSQPVDADESSDTDSSLDSTSSPTADQQAPAESDPQIIVPDDGGPVMPVTRVVELPPVYSPAWGLSNNN